MSRRVGLAAAASGAFLAGAIGIVIGLRLASHGGEIEFDRKARAYMLAHPEILGETVARFRIEPVRQAVETPFAGAWAGNTKGDVTLVMFTDYNCPYCRAMAAEIERLLAEDHRLKVVWRELPILGPDSEAAAAMALAAARHGKYPAFHHALFAGGRPDRQGVAAAARAVGLDFDRLLAESKGSEVRAEIDSNLALARQLEVGGTPYFVIGNRIYEGAIGHDVLVAAVAEARKKA